MKPIDALLVLIIAAILAAAITYIVRAKKKGVKCIGCPAAECCHASRNVSCAGCAGGAAGRSSVGRGEASCGDEGCGCGICSSGRGTCGCADDRDDAGR